MSEPMEATATAQQFEVKAFAPLLSLLAMLKQHAAQLSGLLGGLRLEFLPNFLDSISAFQRISSDPNTPEGMRERILGTFQVIHNWAAVTKTEVDDKLASTLEDLAQKYPQLVDLLANTISGLMAKRADALLPHAMVEAYGVERAEALGVEAAALPGNWTQIIQLIWTIWQVLHPNAGPSSPFHAS